MRRFALILLLARLALPAVAANPVTPKPVGPQNVTVEQLTQALVTAHDRPDAEVAQRISGFELSERLSATDLERLRANLQGDKARQALVILADSAAFLNPPVTEIPANPTPDAAATRQMLVQVVNYVNTTARQLPNLIATRDTIGFEDRPKEDLQEATGLVSYSYLPLHSVGKSSVTVTYRDRQEVVDEGAGKALKHGPQIGGLVTSGEFGPILSRVVADAIQGKITWARWEQSAGGVVAVFRYAVPNQKSHYNVKFCCISDSVSLTDGRVDWSVFDERASYHGEIAFNPENGAILRLSLQAEMPPNELVSKAGMVVEYSPVEIGGKSYICPAKSVSVLLAHTTKPPAGMYSRASYQGASKTFLNDVVFGQYRRFGSETRILTEANEPPAK